MLEVVNAFYTSEVVDRVQPHGIVVSHDYATKKGAIPLPVVFLIESGQRIGERSKSGMFVRLYSDHPFRSRKDGGAHDQFERDALAGLREHPDDPVFRFEIYKDRPSLRYAAARRMDANCINCHNNDRTVPSGIGKWARSAACSRSSARSTATSPATTRGPEGNTHFDGGRLRHTARALRAGASHSIAAAQVSLWISSQNAPLASRIQCGLRHKIEVV